MPNRSVFICLGNSDQPYKNNVSQAGGFGPHLEGLEIILSHVSIQSCVSNGGSIKTEYQGSDELPWFGKSLWLLLNINIERLWRGYNGSSELGT